MTRAAILAIAIALVGCSSSRTVIVWLGSTERPRARFLVEERAVAPWIPGEWETTIRIVKTTDGETTVTVVDLKNKNTIDNLGSGAIGAVAGAVARGGM